MKKRSMVFDSGVVIDILLGNNEGKKIERFIEENLDEIIINELNLEEIKYIVCRKNNIEKAEEVEVFLKSSGYFNIFPLAKIRGEIYRLKCKYTISLADASSIATAKILGISVLFRRLFRREKEIEPFKKELNVIFTDELV
ncbi:PIN domain-containing protein [Sulfolobus sp. S-194]|uniref:PIN domain-containing protein n=1 Tax=Sulfolobus sp. S-194 TaxID=2512240 RepID=UPI002570EA4A|nr:PIN domain-containing protein [Sulfolobus sp. S-194]